MKKIALLALIVVLLPAALIAQTKQINDIFDKYEKKRSIESITISPALLDFMGGGNNQETKDLLSKITELRILNVPNTDTENGTQIRAMLKRDLDALIASENFTRVIKVDNSDEKMEMYMIKGNKGVLLFMTSDNSTFTVISILGEIDKTVTSAVMNGGIKIKSDKR